MSSSRTNIIGLKVHCNACEKEFPILNKQQKLLREDKPIMCKGCKADLVISASEKQRFLAFGNPAKPLMLALMISGLLAVCVFGGTFLGVLQSDGLVLVAVVVMVGSNLVLGPMIRSATKHLMVNLDPKGAPFAASVAP
ncbi:hypothetical protein [Pseudomonas frederiksbergensis]|uniref:hypothetical protein n=1 Tax=Pseudomonas frederiksbergensis TaxID=104087 RepID=UPI003D1D1B8A